STPVRVMNSGVVAVAAGYAHSLALKEDGSVWAWGANGNGQLGDGTGANQTAPVQVLSSGVQAIAAGGAISLFLKTNGSLWVCGENSHGQVGDGSTQDRLVPVRVFESGISSIAGGGRHALAVKNDGSLWAWGENRYGQLGDGSTTDRHLPRQILSATVVTVAAGDMHSLILKADGTLWTCGSNNYGQLGDGTFGQKNAPVQVAENIVSIAAGYATSLALTKTAREDSDTDGLPDDWEQALIDEYANDGTQNLTDVLPNDDFDEDGRTNAEEFDDGTNPVAWTSVVEAAFDGAMSSAAEDDGTANIEVDLKTASQQKVAIDYAVTGGTATGGGVDYTLADGTLIFDPGETSKTIDVAIVDDVTGEPDETVEITLSNPSNAKLGPITLHTVTIRDNDDNTPPVATGITRHTPTNAETNGSGDFRSDVQ
ncbi:MAG: hypothetical protein GXP31_08870, partial [Kiritimatiellaeota bacterium]|nr:hypothetical protein [Kiritimatiellota bacterium]